MATEIVTSMIHSQFTGVVMYRLQNFKKYCGDDMQIINNEYNLKEPHFNSNWENMIGDAKHDVVEDVEVMARQSDIMCFQRFKSFKSLALVDAIREKYPKMKIVMEIDDYALNVPQWNPAWVHYRPGTQLHEIAMEQMRQSDAIIVSTNYLKKLYSEFNKNIFVMENGIDFEWWGDIYNDNHNNEKIRIGWAASIAHKSDLDLLEPVIDELLKRHGDKIEFYLFGGREGMPFHDKKGVILDGSWTNIIDYPAVLKTKGFDIGLAPLRDHDFNRSKSANRFLEWSMLRVPTVASDIGGQFNEVIEDGENGYLAGDEDEWIEKLDKLITDKEFRLDMGIKAFEYVKKHYNCKNMNYGKTFKDIYNLPK